MCMQRKGLPFLLLPLMLASSASYAASIRSRDAVYAAHYVNVTGTVKTPQGEPIIGATIAIKGATAATTTDENGLFRMNLPTGNETLVVSYVGYKALEVAVAGRTDLSIKLEPEEALDEVVVIGYGAVKRRDLTGSVVSVKAEDITARPGPNPMESLQGRVAGLDITRSSGQAGQGVNMQLRGNRSFTADGKP